ncbi:MATE family efflux transporter [Actinobaculum suis]|uniref:MATE family efflux transporter n=1 Tax=Actinobaculum suis TaxID=1657 RepID=UPI0008086DAB|nr:MATE family efflux transporter [Actinobaculum suis]OCA95061.1 MATE family efflux transporter [Actinobaculum suis]OCA95775.1 MATE family efflux transporter [Actinobaculum suis]
MHSKNHDLENKRTQNRLIDREIWRLAIPALGSLLAEPLLTATDSVMVGHLGTQALAGLSLSSTILLTLVGLCIFLAYATTAATARYVGAGKMGRALRHGIDGLWLGGGLGIILALVLFAGAPQVLTLFGASPEIVESGSGYLRFAALGLPGMLINLAATGTIRGLGDTTTPFKVSLVGTFVNIPLNYLFIYPVGWGLVGAAVGTALAQTLMGAWLGGVVARKARENAVNLGPRGSGVLTALRDSVPLIVRTIVLRVAVILQIAAATRLGTEALAANQVTMTVWNFAIYGLDALAMAAQILVGQALGEGNERRVRQVLGRCLYRGITVGVVVGAVLAACSPFLPRLMSSDPEVLHLALLSLIIMGVASPLASIAYIIDGVLIGAGDTRALAYLMCLSLLAYAPAALAVLYWGSGPSGFAWLWIGYGVIFHGARALTTWLRARSSAWIRLGADS